jgi:hypothetical protein
MALPWTTASGGTADVPSGYTYGAVAVRAADQRDRLLSALRSIRFSGWVAPPDDGWVLAIAARAGGAVAAGRRGLMETGAELATELDTTVVAVRVLRDRQLVLAVWSGGDEVGRYVSDPAHGLDDDDVLPMPIGSEHAGAFAAAAGVPEVAGELEELLAEELDPESVIESERLALVLRMLALPGWLVASVSLPHDVPGGPRAREFTRLGAGVPGVAGRLLGRAVEVVRSRRHVPPVLTDPPRATSGPDPWLF